MSASCDGFGATHTSPPGTDPNLSTNSRTPAAIRVGIWLPGLRGLAGSEEKGPIFHDTS